MKMDCIAFALTERLVVIATVATFLVPLSSAKKILARC
jgi:hypothetical protein